MENDIWNKYILTKNKTVEQYIEDNSYLSSIYYARIAEILNNYFNRGDKVLDIGCGSGMWVEYLEKTLKCLSCGLDNNITGFKDKRNYNLIEGDCRSLPFENESFDGVISFGLLEHFPNHKEILKEWMRILKPGSIAIISIPSLNRIDHLTMDLIKNKGKVKKIGKNRIITSIFDYEERWSPNYFKKVCKVSGLEILDFIGLVFAPPPFCYADKLFSNKKMINCVNKVNLMFDNFLPDSLGTYYFIIGRKVSD